MQQHIEHSKRSSSYLTAQHIQQLFSQIIGHSCFLKHTKQMVIRSIQSSVLLYAIRKQQPYVLCSICSGKQLVAVAALRDLLWQSGHCTYS